MRTLSVMCLSVYFVTTQGLVAICDPTVSTTVSGTVTDRVTKRPIVGAIVTLRKNSAIVGSQIDRTIPTSTDGTFKFTNISRGSAELGISHEHYVANPTKLPLILSTITCNNNISLLSRDGSVEYYQNLARLIHDDTMNSEIGQRHTIVNRRWNELRDINLPPSARVIVATELQTTIPEANDIPDLKEYSTIQGDKFKQFKLLEAQFDKAGANPSQLPTPSSGEVSNFSSTLLADLALYKSKDSILTEEKRSAFAKAFLTQWDNQETKKKYIDRIKVDKEFVTPTEFQLNRGEMKTMIDRIRKDGTFSAPNTRRF